MSKRGSFAVVLLCLMACSTNPKLPRGEGCGGDLCTDAQRCDENTLRCVTNELPRLTLSSPTTTISDERFVITGTVTDDTEGTIVSWRDGVDEWRPVEVDAEGAFSFTVPTRRLDSETMFIEVRAEDGTAQTVRATLVLVDRVGPTFELASPAPDVVSGGSAVTITVIARDGSEDLQELEIDDQSVMAPRTGTRHSASVSIPQGDRRSIPVTVTAKDKNGNASTRTFMVLVDGLGPSLRFLTPASQTTISTPALRVALEANDLSGVTQVRVAMDDGGFVAATTDGGAWSAELELPLAEQPVKFFAEATDGAGNKSALAVTARLDRLAPSVELVSPAADSIHRQDFPVRVLAGEDAVTVTATFAGATITLSRDADGSWGGAMPLGVTRDYSAEPLVAAATDAAGNQRNSAPRQLFVDTVAPVITFTAPAAGAKLNASDFTGTDDVLVTWQVQDGDPQAATVSVDGVPTTANQVSVTTRASDDGRSITKTVIASDRRGNVSTASLTFAVDRRAPTVASWLPAANARNVEPRTTTITFSERVSGPTTSSDALIAQSGTWNSAHTTWTSAPLAPYTVVTATLASLTDDFGNPVAPSSRKFHTAALVPPSGLVLANDVSSFQVTADTDGVVTIATTSSAGYRVFGISPTTGAVEPPVLSDPNVGEIRLNSSLTVDPLTLIATHRVGSVRHGGVGAGPLPPVGLVRHLITDGVPVAVGSTADAAGAVLSGGAFAGEADSTAHGLIDGATYRRGVASRTLGNPGDLLVAQSSTSWAGFSVQPGARIAWSRFLCIPSNLGGAPSCQSFAFNFDLTALTSATDLSAAMSPSGRCLAVMLTDGWRTGQTMPLARCNELRPLGAPPHPSCTNTSYALFPMPEGLRVAPFGGHGEDNLLGAHSVGGVPRLQKMSDPIACAGFDTDLGAPAPEVARAFEPVQLGNRAALLYTDVNHTLKLYVP